MKRLAVDLSLCEANGQCVISAPQLFSFGEDGALRWAAEVGDADLGDAEDAVEACPVQAITLED